MTVFFIEVCAVYEDPEAKSLIRDLSNNTANTIIVECD